MIKNENKKFKVTQNVKEIISFKYKTLNQDQIDDSLVQEKQVTHGKIICNSFGGGLQFPISLQSQTKGQAA